MYKGKKVPYSHLSFSSNPERLTNLALCLQPTAFFWSFDRLCWIECFFFSTKLDKVLLSCSVLVTNPCDITRGGYLEQPALTHVFSRAQHTGSQPRLCAAKQGHCHRMKRANCKHAETCQKKCRQGSGVIHTLKGGALGERMTLNARRSEQTCF